ncbi:MAG: GTPase [bacterium]|nr:GTPase [bacterium]
MPSFWRHVNGVLRYADIILEVLDARMIEETRNREIEDKVQRLGKKLLFVFTKCDLVNQERLHEAQRAYHPSVFVSSTDKLGTTILKKKIMELSRGEPVTVGVVGFPNVGKSSLINALAGRGSARTSPESGFTKGIQRVRVSPKIMLLDTPGVFPYKEKDEYILAKIGSRDYSKIREPDVVALKLIGEKKELLTEYYHVAGEEAEEILENIARKFNKLQKGGHPDIEPTARMVLKDWQTGKIQKNNLLLAGQKKPLKKEP